MTPEEVNEFRQLVFVYERMRKAMLVAAKRPLTVSKNIVECRAILAKYDALNRR